MSAPVGMSSSQAYLARFEGDRDLEGWAGLWDKGDVPWDGDTPNPALEEALVKHHATLGGPVAHDAQGTSYRRKALVPGCGRAVDVLLLASFGYDAYGVDYSSTAIDISKKEKEKSENDSQYAVRDPTIGRGNITLVQGDFFDDSWLQKIGLKLNEFNLIYDYGFFCALNPSIRPKWAFRHTQILAPSPRGHLICLESPRHRDPLAPGPPYASPSKAYMEHLSRPGAEVVYDDAGLVTQDPLWAPSKIGLERVAYWQPERAHNTYHEIGEDGTIFNRVSIWRRHSSVLA